MARQLSLDLSPSSGAGPADFIVSDSNAAAHAAVLGETPWPQGKLWLAGPESSGKTHLARLWAARHGATLLPAAALPAALAGTLPPPGAAIVIDGLDSLSGRAEEALFHLHNHLAATGGLLLMTARTPPARLPVALPDLASRLQATALAQIADPDDRLLALLLARHFADRHILPSAGLIPWLLTRIERSHAAALATVDLLDRTALAEGRAITRDFARTILDNSADSAR